MRVAIVGNFGLTGNQTMAVRALPIARGLAGGGHAVRMALPARSIGDGAIPLDTGVDIRYAFRPGSGPFAYPLQAAVLAWLCFRWRPDVVYCFKPIAHSGIVLAVFRVLRGFGLFRGVLALDTDDWEGDGGWNEKQPFPGWLKRAIAWQERWSLQHADVVTAASIELVKLAGGCGARKVAYVPNCLDVPIAPHDRDHGGSVLPPRSGSHPLVLIYTRFVEYRLERLLDTFRGVSDQVPTAGFVVVGTGLSGEEEELKRLVASGGLASRVAIVGWAQPEKLPGYFDAATIALYLLDDNLLNRTKCPVKLLELVSAGVPVVADRVGQASEYVVDGETGVLVEAGDVAAMAEAASSLIADEERRQRISLQARERSARWRWSAWLPEVEKSLGLTKSPAP